MHTRSKSTISGFSLAHYALSHLAFACAAGAGIAAPVHADALLDEPLALSERAPLTQRFNLPGARSGQLLGEGASQWRLGVDLANNYVRDSVYGGNGADAETLVFDGELQRYELGVRYGLGAQWEVGVTLPWMAYRGGVLDPFINRWHRAWGLPDHHRSDYASDQLQFMHASNGRVDVEFDSPQSGFGDVQLQLANQIVQTGRDSIALIAHINLPSGDDAKLTGGGGTGAGMTLALTHSGWLDLPLTLNANIGVQSLPQSDVLEARQKDSVWFGSGEIAWAASADWRLRAQLGVHSAFYDSELASLGDTSAQLLLGGSVRLDAHWVLDAALGEDILLDTAPDITFQLALKARY